MHSVISAFDTRDEADRALERLVDSGIPRHDVHIEHHALYGEGGAMRKSTWDGMEREVAVDRGVLESIGRFFTSILGQDNPSGRVDTYAQHVEQGRFVLVMDGRDEAEAARAHQILSGIGGRDHAVVQRPALPPLRDVVAQRQAGTGLRYGDDKPR